MKSFTYYAPTEIVFGKDAEKQLPAMIKRYNGSRVMLVYGTGSAVRSGLLPELESLLAKESIAYITFGGVEPNPILSHTREGIERAVKWGADMIIGVGGGSAIDAAKAIAHGTANPDTDIWKFWKLEEPLTKSLPVGVVLTISAAGSETSGSAVITNKETGEKRGIATEFNRPRFALMNPALTFTLPPHQIACGIADIMMHTLDRYFTPVEGNEFTDELAEALLRTVIKNGRIAMADPADYDAMSELMWCGSLSHTGITGLGRPLDFTVHQLGHELGGKFGIAHGESLAIMWGFWAKYVYKIDIQRFARYAGKVWGIADAKSGEEAALAGIDATVAFFREIGLPVCFSDSSIGIQTDDVIADLALRCTFYEKRLVGQFKKMGKEELAEIYKTANV